MKKLFSFFLAVVMIFCICGCQKNGDKTNTSSENIVVEHEEIVVDQDGNVITSSESTITENQESNTQNIDSSDNTISDSSTTSSTEDIIVDYEAVVELDICDDVIRSYLNATEPQQQFTILNTCQTMVLDYQCLPLKYKSDGSIAYKLYISENADFSNAYISDVTGSFSDGMVNLSKTNAICIPGKTYYWKVIGRNDDIVLGGGRFHLKDAPVRWIKIDGVSNVRDMGGWKTESGKTVRYEKIYRGARFDNITNVGINTLKALGIKTDIDIRSTATWDSHGAVEATGLNYYFFDTSAHYDFVFNNGGEPVPEVKENYPKIFELLADESNYPIYLHCNFGNDRTGSMAFILNGLLGVTYEDLTRDYELTSFAFEHDNRWRGDGIGGTFGPNDLIQHNISNSDVDGRWGMMNKAFMESKYCTDGKLSTAIEKFLLDAGVKQQHIDAYKKIMLG